MPPSPAGPQAPVSTDFLGLIADPYSSLLTAFLSLSTKHNPLALLPEPHALSGTSPTTHSLTPPPPPPTNLTYRQGHMRLLPRPLALPAA